MITGMVASDGTKEDNAKSLVMVHQSVLQVRMGTGFVKEHLSYAELLGLAAQEAGAGGHGYYQGTEYTGRVVVSMAGPVVCGPLKDVMLKFCPRKAAIDLPERASKAETLYPTVRVVKPKPLTVDGCPIDVGELEVREVFSIKGTGLFKVISVDGAVLSVV